MELNKLYHGDCLEIMKDIPDGSIDMILCDLPYGTTASKWDTVIPFEPLWRQYERIIKEHGAIILTASQPFTSALVMSNPRLFRYSWVWNKRKPGNIFLARYQPMKVHEDVLVFSKQSHKYYPQKIARETIIKSKNYGTGESFGGNGQREDKVYENIDKNPVSIIDVSNANQRGKVHPTQKPVPLFEYLIRTYTNEGETVLDNCIGSGTTAIAAHRTNRKWIGMELDKEYYELAKKRIEVETRQKRLF